MYVFLNKKIAIPNNVHLRTLGWNVEHGFLCCGGDDRLLKVLKLDVSKEAGGLTGIAAPTNLTMNQTLEGHRGSVTSCTWNTQHRKLATSDAAGLIIVWVLHRGVWYEEMINNRGKSVVADMRWRPDGSQICIGYRDGYVILGGVDGNRVWGADLGVPLTHLEWSPDGRYLIFATGDGPVFTRPVTEGAPLVPISRAAIADILLAAGIDEYATTMPLDTAGAGAASSSSSSAAADGATPVTIAGSATPATMVNGVILPRVVAVEWYDGAEGYLHPAMPSLVIAWSNGRAQLMRSAIDPHPVLLDTGFKTLVAAKWNSSGTVLALAGLRPGTPAGGRLAAGSPPLPAAVASAVASGVGGKDSWEVQFYTPFGRYMSTMKVPGGVINAVAWEGGGLRLALAVDHYVFFANARPLYSWARFAGNVLAYSTARPDKAAQVVVFWNTATDERYVKQVHNLISIHGAGDHCLVVATPRRQEPTGSSGGDGGTDGRGGAAGKAGGGGGGRGAGRDDFEDEAADYDAMGDDPMALPATVGSRGIPLSDRYALILFNSIGMPVDNKVIDVSPDHVTMTPTHVVVASGETVYTWHYRTSGAAPGTATAGGVASGGKLTSTLASAATAGDSASGDWSSSGGGRRREGRERRILLGAAASGSDASGSASTAAGSGSVAGGTVSSASSGSAAGGAGGVAAGGAGASGAGATGGDPVCCVAASERILLVARESGVVQQYAFPTLAHEANYRLRCRPSQMHINCDGTQFAIIDIASVLTLFDMTATGTAPASGGSGAAGGGSGAGSSGVVVGGTIVPAGGIPFTGEHLAFERKDIWQFLWAEDYPDLWVAMEKTRMYIFRGTTAEEPAVSSGFLFRFNDLTITSTLLDDIMTQPDKPTKERHIVQHDTRSLRDTRMLLSRGAAAAGGAAGGAGTGPAAGSSSSSGGALTGIALRDALTFIEENAHPRLWRLLAQTALERLDLNTAERAFVSVGDYAGVQFVKQLRTLHDRSKQRAEVAIHFGQFDDAERIYLDIDRRDLAIDMRMRVGDWRRVLLLLQGGSSTGKGGASGGAGGGAAGDDAIVSLARQKLGDFHADRQRWRRAIVHYEAANCTEALVECYYVAEEYEKLAALTDTLPEGSPLLYNIAQKLQSVGLSDAAASALLRAGDVKGAIDCCVAQNQWDRALELADKHKLPQIEGLLLRYASRLLESDKPIAAVELYRQTGRDADGAKILAKLAADTGKSRLSPLRAKKLFVLAAMEVEAHRKRTMDMAALATAAAAGGGGSGGATAAGATLRGGSGGRLTAGGDGAAAAAAAVTLAGGGRGGGGATVAAATAATLNTLMRADAEAAAGIGTSSDAAAARTLDAAWHGALAYHFYMLAQRQLYAGDPAAAMVTALRLALYDDILDPKDIHCIIALTAYYNGCYGTCSRAFIRLEGLETISPVEREGFADLALAIFTDNAPTDPPNDATNSCRCPTAGCGGVVKRWATFCMGCGATFPACVATGKPLFAFASTGTAAGTTQAVVTGSDGEVVIRCGTCRHRYLAAAAAAAGLKTCPLCHAPAPSTADGGVAAAAATGRAGAAAAGVVVSASAAPAAGASPASAAAAKGKGSAASSAAGSASGSPSSEAGGSAPSGSGGSGSATARSTGNERVARAFKL